MEGDPIGMRKVTWLQGGFKMGTQEQNNQSGKGVLVGIIIFIAGLFGLLWLISRLFDA